MLRRAKNSDVSNLVALFSTTIEGNKTYISHGEIQMGVAVDRQNLALDYKVVWEAYITRLIDDEEFANVLVFEKNTEILGFIVGTIENDNAQDYGIINDICVNPSTRGQGLGETLFNATLDWFRSKGLSHVYLESGLNNHSAHDFFENRGFTPVSKIFMREL